MFDILLGRSFCTKGQSVYECFHTEKIMEGVYHLLSLSFTNTISSPPFFFYPFCSQLLGFLFSLFYLSHSYLCESHILGMAILGVLSIFTMRLHCYHPPSTISSFIFGRTLDSNLIIHVKSFRKDSLLFKYSLQCGTLTGVFKDPSASWICREGLKVLEN